MNLIFIAPPSAGKGTISSKLVDNFDYQHISTGDLLREEINKGTDLGNSIKSIIDNGELVNDDLIIELVKVKLESLKDCKFIFDGFPRNIDQAKILNDIFASLNIDNYIAIYLEVSFDELSHRVTGRQICNKCHKSYNIYADQFKPKVAGICDVCGTELITRDDDSLETFTKRYDTYVEMTEPVISFYKDLNKLVIVEGENSSDVAYKNILEILGEK